MDSGVLGQIPALWSACHETLGQSPASFEPSILTVRWGPCEGLNRVGQVVCNPLKPSDAVCFYNSFIEI